MATKNVVAPFFSCLGERVEFEFVGRPFALSRSEEFGHAFEESKGVVFAELRKGSTDGNGGGVNVEDERSIVDWLRKRKLTCEGGFDFVECG